MRQMTYILQAASVGCMFSAIMLAHSAYERGLTPLVIINAVLFAANLALFIWQGRIRARNQ
jgi:hypothetical protein